MLQVARVAVHVAAAAVGGLGRVGRLVAAAQPTALHRRQVVRDVLQRWENKII